jgi:polyhydroxyalkanoate synthesis repressor PhaR
LPLYGKGWHSALSYNTFCDIALRDDLEITLWVMAMAEKTSENGDPIIIKKYANRRLYNTASSSYVTLEHLCQMVKDDVEFFVLDAKGNDITRTVLTQIIVEEEAKGENLLPLSFLRQLISYYGDNVQRMLLPHYLEYSIDAFAKNQDEIQTYMEDTFGNMSPFGQFENMGKQNLEMFEQAMRMFTPFEGKTPSKPTSAAASPAPSEPSEDNSNAQTLQQQLDALQAQLNKMTGDKS